VVAIQVGALRADGGTDRGLRTTYAFASPGNRRATGSFENFVRIVRGDTYDDLLAHERVEYGPVTVADATATRRVRVTDRSGNATTYRFELAKQRAGRYEGCWMTSGVVRVGTDAAPAGENRSSLAR
jgi:hypothetical protein